MNEVIVSPEDQKQMNEVNRLRTSLSMIIMEKDELEQVICVNLKTEYMLKIGDLEYKVFRAMCGYLRAKRKNEMTTALANRGEKADLNEIERALESEFIEYRRKLDEKLAGLNEAIRRKGCRSLSESETRELKTLYRRIVKKLHPDLNPDLSEAQLQLYQNAVEAYRNGDIRMLRFIDTLACQEVTETMVSLETQAERLERAITHVKRQISELKNSFPYTMRDLLNDPEAVARKRTELEAQIREYEEARERYERESRQAVMN